MRNAKEISVDVNTFSNALEEVDWRYLRMQNPAKQDSKALGIDAWLWEDPNGQGNWHLMYQKITPHKPKKVMHLKCNIWSEDAPLQKGYDAGSNAWKRFLPYLRKSGEVLDYVDNKALTDKYKTDHYLYYSSKIRSNRWYRAVAFDMHKCYFSYFDKPLPDTKLCGENRLCEEDELGFITAAGDTPGEEKIILNPFPDTIISNWIFKKRYYKSLAEFAKSVDNKLQEAKQSNDYWNSKQQFEAFLGYLKHRNIFIRATILGYSRAYMESIRRKHPKTILQMTVDSIVTTDPSIEKELDMGPNMGQFAIEHNGYFISKSPAAYAWYNEEYKCKGDNGLKRIDWNHQYIDPAWILINRHIKIFKERRIMTLWPILKEEEAKFNSLEFSGGK